MEEVEVEVVMEAEQQVDLLNGEGQPTVVEDLQEDNDTVPLYLFIL